MTTSVNEKQYNHYFKRVPVEIKPDGSVGPVTHIDVYNVLAMWDVYMHAQSHALKKLLCAGDRGHKDYVQDLREVIACIQRELELYEQRCLMLDTESNEFEAREAEYRATEPAPDVTEGELQEHYQVINEKLKAMVTLDTGVDMNPVPAEPDSDTEGEILF